MKRSSMDGEVLEKAYKERLEEKIISYLAESENLDLPTAMDIYYNSKLADRIAAGEYGIQYLDYKVLVQILAETELQTLLHK
ncbi:MAG: hypothetical protein II103_06195 [Treponema sp.]|nr:hypothetical protein [Treponema sp.]MBQ1670716.1 hypothetical protein [Treponema sp.]MBQ2206736.1 hypothetical protein [Treponema sp.]MBQ2356259.1 hypothetical protein [Treponema sp.]MBQ2571725.1 hypothetical protein [Treponema sp.]